MDVVQSSIFVTCEYNPPGNVEGEFPYASFRHSTKIMDLRGFLFFFLAKTFKSKVKILAFYLHPYTYCVDELDSSGTHLVILIGVGR